MIKIINCMSENLDTILAWLWMSMGWLSLGNVIYEFHICSEKYAKRDIRRRIKNGLPPYDNEEGQLYFEFMKDYV